MSKEIQKETKKNTKKKEQNVSQKKHEKKFNFEIFYRKYYKILMVIPIFLFLVSLILIYNTILIDGTPINRDVSLKGGLSVIINTDSSFTSEEFEDSLENDFSDNSFLVSELLEDGQKVGFIIDTDLDEEIFKDYISSYFGEEFDFGENYNSNFISSTLSNAFFLQAVYILIISFVLMSIVIFLYFREFVPSLAVVLSAIFDLIVTIGVLNLFDFKVSIAGIGALIMLVGYSIDTDVLLTNRLIKEYGSNYLEKSFFAFKTGALMSFTTLSAGVVGIILTYIGNSGVIFEIALILVIGLLVDFISTWIQNLGILLWWLEKKEGKI